MNLYRYYQHDGFRCETTAGIVKAKDMQEAVETAKNESQPGDVVILSPACASFDLYKDFEERGNHFKSIVKNII